MTMLKIILLFLLLGTSFIAYAVTPAAAQLDAATPSPDGPLTPDQTPPLTMPKTDPVATTVVKTITTTTTVTPTAPAGPGTPTPSH